MGKVRYTAGEAIYAAIGTDCSDYFDAAKPSDNNLDGYKWGVRGVLTDTWYRLARGLLINDDGFGQFRYVISDYVASDLLGMNLNIFSYYTGESLVCCTFYDPFFVEDRRILDANQN